MSSTSGRHRLDSLQTQRVAAGLTVARLAAKSTTSDYLIQSLENGGACTVDESARIAAALSVSLATLGKQDL